MVVRTSLWPRSSCTVRMSWPASSRWVAKLWRRVWQVAGLTIPAGADGLLDRLWRGGLGQVVAADRAPVRGSVDARPVREEVLPSRFPIGVGILLAQGVNGR